MGGLALGLGLGELPGMPGGALPGQGGVSRGLGPAALMGRGRTGAGFGGFQEKSFRGNMGDPEVPLGFAFSPPDDTVMEKEATFDRPGQARQFRKGNERITWHSRLLPRHNAVLKNFFQKKKKRSPEK